MAFNVYSKKGWISISNALKTVYKSAETAIPVSTTNSSDPKTLQSKWIKETWSCSLKLESLAQYFTILFCANTFFTSQWRKSCLSVLSFALILVSKGAKKLNYVGAKQKRNSSIDSSARITLCRVGMDHRPHCSPLLSSPLLYVAYIQTPLARKTDLGKHCQKWRDEYWNCIFHIA